MSPLSHHFFCEVFIGGRYHRDIKAMKILASNSMNFRIGDILKNWQIWCASANILNTTFFLITSVSNNL